MISINACKFGKERIKLMILYVFLSTITDLYPSDYGNGQTNKFLLYLFLQLNNFTVQIFS